MDNIQGIIDNLTSTDPTAENTVTFKELLEKSNPETITKVVVEKILPSLFKSETKNRKEILNLIIDCTNVEAKYLNKRDASKFKLLCKQFVEDIDKLRITENSDWSVLCITLFRILGTALHNDVDIINRILRIVENGFRNKSIDQKCEAYKCWKELIRNYSLVPPYMKQAKQMKLLIKPLKVPLSRQACVVEIRFDTFVLLLEALEGDAANSYLDFLQFVFHIGNLTTCEATVILPSYKQIWPKSATVLFQSLGCEGNIEHICNYTTKICAIIDTRYFENNYKLLVYSVRICSELTYHWCSKVEMNHIIEPIWTTIFILSNKSALEKEILLTILEHFSELFQNASSNNFFIYNYILMPVLEIVYKNPELNSLLFRSDFVIPFLKLYITHTSLHIRSRNETLAKLVSFVYSSHTLAELYSVMDSLNYSEVLELIWFQCNSIFISEVQDHSEHNISKVNILTYLKWPLGNIKYLNTNDCILKLWKSTIMKINQSETDIIYQLLDAFKLIQHKNNWIIVNIMIVAIVFLEIAERQTTTMEYIVLTINECMENSSGAMEQFLLYKKDFYQCYMTLLKNMTGNATALTSMLQSLDKLVNKMPEFIIKSIPDSFVLFMQELSKLSNSNEALSLVTKLKPQALHSTPTIISRAKKMASLNYKQLLPNFPRKSVSNDSRFRTKQSKTLALSPSTDITGFEYNLGASPNSVKSSFIDKIKKKKTKPLKQDKFSINTRTKNIMEFADSAFVHIDKKVTPDHHRMNTHQRDATRRRRDDIPALYSNLSQSQSQNFHSISPDTSSQSIETVSRQLQNIPIQNIGESESESRDQISTFTEVIPLQSTIETENNCADTAIVIDKASDLMLDEISANIEKVPRKKLFNDDSKSHSSTMDINFVNDKLPRKDEFNAGSGTDSVSAHLNKDEQLKKEAPSDLNVTPEPIITNTNDIDIIDNSDTIKGESASKVKNIRNKESLKTDELYEDDQSNEIKTRSSTRKQSRISEQQVQQSKTVEYFQNRSPISKRKVGPKDYRKKSSPSKGDKCEHMRIESSSKSSSNFACPSETTVDKNNEAVENNTSEFYNRPDVTKNEMLKNQEISIGLLDRHIALTPYKVNSKSLKISYKSKSNSKTPSKGKIKFFAKWNKYNSAPAKCVTSDMDVYPSEELNDFHAKEERANERITVETESVIRSKMTDKSTSIVHSEVNKDINSSKIKNNASVLPISMQANYEDESVTENSPDIILETQPVSNDKVIFPDKLKNELNRLRMDIVGGDIAASITSKRIRKEKINLSTPKRPRKNRNQLRLINDIELNSDHANQYKNLDNKKESIGSTNLFTSESVPESEATEHDVDQLYSVSTGGAAPAEITEKDLSSNTWNRLKQPSDCTHQNSEIEITTNELEQPFSPTNESVITVSTNEDFEHLSDSLHESEITENDIEQPSADENAESKNTNNYLDQPSVSTHESAQEESTKNHSKQLYVSTHLSVTSEGTINQIEQPSDPTYQSAKTESTANELKVPSSISSHESAENETTKNNLELRFVSTHGNAVSESTTEDVKHPVFTLGSAKSDKNDLEASSSESAHANEDVKNPQPLDSNDIKMISQPLDSSETEFVNILNSDSEIPCTENAQRIISEIEDGTQFSLPEEKAHDTGPHETFDIAEHNMKEKVTSSITVVDNIKEKTLSQCTIDSTDKKISSIELISKNNTEDKNSETAHEIMDTQPIDERSLNISFIGSMNVEPHDSNHDMHKDILHIGIHEIDTESCGFNKPITIEDLQLHGNNETELIPSSPVTNITPSKNKKLLNDTLNISPIATTSNAAEVSDSPDLFESETVTVMDKIPVCKLTCLAQENDDDIKTNSISDCDIDVLKQNVDVPKVNNNAFVSYLTPLKLLTSSSIVSSPKTHRIQKMMQNLEDKNSNNTADSKEFVTNYTKEDLLEFSTDLPKADARPRTPSILKRKAPDYLDEGLSPLSKRKRVNFSDPPTTSSKVYLKSDEENFIQRVLKKTGKLSMKARHLNNPTDMVFNIKVNIKNNANSSDAQLESECTDATKLLTTESEDVAGALGELSDLYPELIDCTEDIDLLFYNLTTTTVDIKNKGIRTIGDILRLKRSEVKDLPIAEPKFTRLNSALSLYCCKHKNITYEDDGDDNIHKIISVDCSEKSISNVNIINNIILSPKQIDKDVPSGLPAICQIIKTSVRQLVREGYSADVIGEQLNNILRSCDLPLSVNLPYY